MKKSDIVKYLKDQDEIREEIKQNVDAIFKKVDVDKLMNNPKVVIGAITAKIIAKNKKLFKESEEIGLKLKDTL